MHLSEGINGSTVHAMGGAHPVPFNRLQGLLTPFPRDKSFKLAEFGFLQILPAARAKRGGLFFISVGFDGEIEAKLHGIYRRHDIAGLRYEMPASASDLDADVLAQLDSTSGMPVSTRFDCLSVLGGVASTRLLGTVCDGKFRPGLIHCADTNSFDAWSKLRLGLLAKGYVCVGELEGAEMFLDAPLFDAPDLRPEIATHDIFDTLIARRCIEPWRIFETVGEITALADFVQQRREAEERLAGKTYVFDDIYDELARHYRWSPERRRDIQALELTCERDAVIPITENLSRVRDGDLLVSDSYLGEEAIRGLLDEVGLTANVGLLVESDGKGSGRVWPLIDAQFKVRAHRGSNTHADVAAPARFGFETSLTRSSALNLVERTLLQSGLRDLALLCREARLASWHDDPALRAIQSVQTSLNLPLLILASVSMARRAVALGKTSIAFCSDDGALWMPVFNLVQAKMGLNLKTASFLSSRVARSKGSDAYVDYARRRIQAGTLVADLRGTGASMASLADRLGLAVCDVFIIDHYSQPNIVERARPSRQACVMYPLFTKRPNGDGGILELANKTSHATVVDMRAVGSALVPVLASEHLSEGEVFAIEEQSACFLESLDLVDNYALQDVLDLDDPSIAFLCTSLYEYMSKQTDCFQMFTRKA